MARGRSYPVAYVLDLRLQLKELVKNVDVERMNRTELSQSSKLVLTIDPSRVSISANVTKFLDQRSCGMWYGTMCDQPMNEGTHVVVWESQSALSRIVRPPAID